nr:probable disease resistance protein At4g27220 [Ziziphus jujuba var. spinosa]XP_048324478.1 probable disease resistance protein At4g27220 [Ziziphus jujuba var. spinosa]XP_048324479.1 probable disease resistance protein At4g27220 [Ziziphus jujuba var. spinosa]XP_048324480.1 probable disease resistance protein At4g27220 [Ziziphus jujuba var. spinosa]
MDQFIISIGAKISEYTVGPVLHELGYSCHYKSNVDNLKTQIQLLEGAKDRVEHSVDEATRNGEEIEADVQNWLIRVTNIAKNAEDVFKRVDHANSLCSCKIFQMLVSRHKLSKKAETMAKDADAEIKLAITILSQKVSYAVPPKGVIEFGHGGYMTFDSRIYTIKNIMDTLRNPNVRMVGIYGMAGIGKTMLAKEVARQAMEEKLFDKMVKVTISQTLDVKKIQREIAEHLGLKLDEESISVRAERLSRRLRQEKKILIVLDDVWKKLELHEVGIAFGNDKNGCKILLTSRFEDVVQSEMGADKIFLLGVLYDNEATDLFGKIVGDSMMNNPEFQPWASDIIKECGGLPIAIETVANALKNRRSPVWGNALQELRRSVPTNIKGMHEKVYSSIKLSYNYLESDEAKLMLLYIGLYPEDYWIAFITFFICGIGLELFQGIKGLEQADNKVVTLVESLKTCCFLSDGPFPRTLTMHDVIQDVVISIGSQEKQMFCFRNYDPEVEDSKKLKDATAISLLYSTDDSRLPERLKCPQLKFLLVLCYDLSLWSDRYSQMSNHFFEEIKDLRVLELFRLCLTTLPRSFCFLQNLQSLGLYKCDLGDVALIGELKSLKILVIVWL